MNKYNRFRHLVFTISTITLLCLSHVVAAQQRNASISGDWLRLSPNIRLATPAGGLRTYVLLVKNLQVFDDWKAKNNIPVSIVKTHADYSIVEIACSADIFKQYIYPNADVLYADSKGIPKEETSVESVDLSLNGISVAHQLYPQLNGNGLVVSVKENRFDTADIDFKNRQRLTSGTSSNLSSHATSMATLIAGAGNSYYKGKGAAWAALLNSTTFNNLLPEEDVFYTSNQVLVQNHSYGTSIESFYGLDAAGHDKSSITIPSLLHIFSAGNSGQQVAATGTYANISGLSNLTGNFKMAKNIITVGATDSFGVVSPLSSKGPAYDGRVKPELVAMGEDGTSGAAALTSGTAMLLHQAYQQVNGGSKAPSALLKAALLTGATDAGTPGVDFSSGFGQLNAVPSLQIIYNGTHRSNIINQAQNILVPVSIPPGISTFKATLVWNDPAAAANSAKALVNDLDLTLVSAGGQETLPWILSIVPSADSLRKPARRGIDTLNNAEQVTLQNPAPGNYQLKITGSKVPSGPQSFSVAWSMDTANTFRWMFPLREDAVVADKRNILRWQTTFTMPLKAEYSYDGSNWQLIADNINPATGFQSWQVPDTFALAFVRITAGAATFVSDSIVISRLMSVQIGYNCADSFLYIWKPLAPGRYTAWQLGNTYMEQTGTLTDTVFAQSKAGNPVLYYAFAPVLNNGRAGIRSYAINYREQGTGCYFNTFLAFLDGTTTALRAEIATGYKIKTVRMLNTSTGNKVISTFNPTVDGLVFEATDPAPKRGVNVYITELELTDGRKIYSSAEEVYFSGDKGIFVFPNPAARGSSINIVTKDLGAGMFVLYNTTGKKLLERRLGLSREILNTNWLSAGNYFYRIIYDAGKSESGTIVIQ